MKKQRLLLLTGSLVLLGCVSAAWLGLTGNERCRAGENDDRTPPVRARFLAPVAVDLADEPVGPRVRLFDAAPTGDKKPEGPATLIAESALFPAEEQPIDFFAALQLAEAQNPDIGLSRQAIQEALALQLQARAMLLPTAHAGGNYRNHQGVLQNSSGRILNPSFNSFYVGNGANAISAGTVNIPGLQIFGHLGDGIFESLAARQLVAVRNYQAQANNNQVLLEVAQRYLDLVRAEAELKALHLTQKDMEQVVFITRAFAKVKQGRQADALRAETSSFLLQARTVGAEEGVLTAAAELARVLSLDPVIRLRSPEAPTALLELVDVGQNLDTLLALAQSSRPELAAQSAEIARRKIQVRQEMTRPLFPTVSLGFSAGSFGGGTNGNAVGRTDVDLIAFWTLQNMGAGNRALQRGRQSEEEMAILERDRIANIIGREVADARARALARREDLDIARSRVTVAERAFNEDLVRIRGNVGLPIELLNSVNRLAAARVDVVRVTQEYNLAQMQLFVAIGQNPLAANASR